MSPFLSIMQLAMVKPRFADLIMYADDGIFHSDTRFTSEDVKAWAYEVGVPISEEKSG